MGRNDDQIRCSFCNKSQAQVKKLIAGPNDTYICDECVEVCSEIIEEEMAYDENDSWTPFSDINLLKPEEIKEFLDDYVIGQDEAKKVLSVAVYNHYKRIMAQRDLGVELNKSNILMLGPTGCGKTLLAQSLAKILNVPFAIADATALTEAGYVGEDVENILLKLIQAADYDIERAEYGIIYLDEIDKITRKSENPSITRDVSGEGVQQALLKIVEGTVANVPPQGGRKHPHQELIQIDTTNILFICGGAFEGIDKIIEKRIDQKSIGFNAEIAEKHEDDVDKLLAQVLPQDLVKFGLIPELVGRVPVTVSLEMLDHDALIRILTEPKNAIVKQYQKLLELDGVKLVFDDSALNEIADISLKRKTGARGLRAIMENTMMDIMYRAPSDETLKTCRITGDVVTGKAKPECEQAMKKDQKVFLVMQKEVEVEEPKESDLYRIGCIATVKQIVKLPGNMKRVLVSGEQRAGLSWIESEEPYFQAAVKILPDFCKPEDRELLENPINEEGMVRGLRELFRDYMSKIPKKFWKSRIFFRDMKTFLFVWSMRCAYSV